MEFNDYKKALTKAHSLEITKTLMEFLTKYKKVSLKDSTTHKDPFYRLGKVEEAKHRDPQKIRVWQ